ncbi:LLM class flavin-dependent oxidoreductase [Ancylobacter sp. 6x-1]|uniref:LLM class flavin-dependent oxidoreductase n=1 Tax=Ancylobacter crimeensis TaxID=2579147 RepID=A0ABT0DFM8_9HYPH|nr:LLM class flavin-dependent oxidoreductase [Ancylobacter crimeensis]MCK0198776.1 LLM class flavin-dependent oxidoreductase [Ancylobacter crimeensis]
MADPRHMILGLLALPNGSHSASWLLPGAQDGASVDIEHYRRLAQAAERGKFDFFFIADQAAVRMDRMEVWSRAPSYTNILEPITLLAAVAGSTRHIGLGATACTTFCEPYTIARQFASLDHISGGRAAWNVVTGASHDAARNYGMDQLPSHEVRYDRAREFVEVALSLWDTWEDDAFVHDHAEGRVYLPEKFHPTRHAGTHFRVDGGLNIARAPQGRPVVIQAGASETGKQLAAETAELVFGPSAGMAAAQTFYRDLKGRLPALGRARDALKIVSGVSMVLGEDEAEARARLDAWHDHVHPDVARVRIGEDLEADLMDLPLDAPIPQDRIPLQARLHKAYSDEIIAMVRQGLTLREICRRYNRSRAVICGSPVAIADMMEEWVASEACDGFMLSFLTLPGCLDDFVDKVVPELQRRGLFRREYEGGTLRDLIGLPRPANRHVGAAATSRRVEVVPG